MSEVKHVTLTTISDVKKPNSAPETSNKTKEPKTIRLEFNLFEPTAESFPEFNYAKLVHEEKKRCKKTVIAKHNGSLDDCHQEDDVARMAKEFEKKYGKLDYCDRGAGYDEEDSFIDNTEAYDELIPEEIETDKGGFYVNSGHLEFKQLSNFERPGDADRMPKAKKRQLSSSSSSSGSDMEEKEKGKEPATTNLKQLNGHVGKKQKTLPEINAKPKSQKTTHKEKEIENKISNNTTNSKSKKDGSDSGKETAKVIKTTTVKDMLRAQRDSLRKKEQVKTDETDSSSDSEDDESNKDSDSDSSDEVSASDTSGKSNGSKNKKEVKLPEDLPDHLLQDIISIKEIAKETGGKIINFFELKVSELLLQIDVSARMCSLNTRNQIYKHLELHLGCSRQSLMVKIKKIRVQKEDNKVKKALMKLKTAIVDIMPQVLLNYEADCIKIEELKIKLASTPGENGEKLENTLKAPRKKFHWNDNLRNMLYDIVTIRKQSFNILKPKKENIDEYCANYLKQHVVPIWPTGFVKYEDIQKELDRRKKVNKNKESKKVEKSVIPSAIPSTSASSSKDLPVDIEKAVLPPKPDTKQPINSSVDDVKLDKTTKTEPVKPKEIETKAAEVIPKAASLSSAATAQVAKKSSDHSIISIISSPPTLKTTLSSHSVSKPVPPPPPVSFDEDQIPTNVINLDGTSLPLKIKNFANLKTTSNSSSSSQNSSKDNKRPPTPAATSIVNLCENDSDSNRLNNNNHNHNSNNNNNNNNHNNNSNDYDSDSSVEIVEEFSSSVIGCSSSKTNNINPLNMNLNKDKYKSIVGKRSKPSNGSSTASSTSSSRSSSVNNNNHDKKLQSFTPNVPIAAAEIMKGSNASYSAGLDGSNKDGELDVNQIMKELKELQELQRTTKGDNNKYKLPTGSMPSNSSHSKAKETEHHSTPKDVDDHDFLFSNYAYSSKYNKN